MIKCREKHGCGALKKSALFYVGFLAMGRGWFQASLQNYLGIKIDSPGGFATLRRLICRRESPRRTNTYIMAAQVCFS